MDLNFSDKNQLFYRFSYVDDPAVHSRNFRRHC